MVERRCVHFLRVNQVKQLSIRGTVWAIPRSELQSIHVTYKADSGRHIVNILKNNSSKVPDRYRGEDIDHMGKVVSYCKKTPST